MLARVLSLLGLTAALTPALDPSAITGAPAGGSARFLARKRGMFIGRTKPLIDPGGVHAHLTRRSGGTGKASNRTTKTRCIAFNEYREKPELRIAREVARVAAEHDGTDESKVRAARSAAAMSHDFREDAREKRNAVKRQRRAQRAKGQRP